MPKIKKTVLKDFQKLVLVQAGLEELSRNFNKSDMIYDFDNGSEIQFISADNSSKIHGLRTDVLYCDEVNHIHKDIFDQLSIRTKEKIMVSCNPTSKFYIHDEFEREDCVVIHSTYKDNHFVPAEIIKELEHKAKFNKNFRRIYLEGKIGVAEGLVLDEDTNYKIVQEKPNIKVTQTIYGMDFGFSDPTTLCKVELFEDKSLYITELLYKSKLTGELIIKELHKLGLKRTDKIIADSARPELIQTIFNGGFNIHSVRKTKIIDGINNLMDYEIYIDYFSENLIKELRNYTWEKNKEGEQIDKPIDNHNHLIDAIRYALTKIRKQGNSSMSCDLI